MDRQKYFSSGMQFLFKQHVNGIIGTIPVSSADQKLIHTAVGESSDADKRSLFTVRCNKEAGSTVILNPTD